MPIVNKVAFKNKAVIKTKSILNNKFVVVPLLYSLFLLGTANATSTNNTTDTNNVTNTNITKAQASQKSTELTLNQQLSTMFSATDYQEYIVQYNKAFKKHGNKIDALMDMKDHFIEYDYDHEGITDKKLLAKIELWYSESNRFAMCKNNVQPLVVFARSMNTFANDLSKDEILESDAHLMSIDYPFTEEETNSSSVVYQILLMKAWQYKGMGEAGVDDFLLTCLKQPASYFAS